MPAQETDPIEKKSYGKIFFVVGSIFFLIAIWAFYSEVISRRSWKGYQREFNALELKRVQTEYEKLKQQLDAEDAKKDAAADPVSQANPDSKAPFDDSPYSLRKIRLKIEEAEIRMESPELKKLEAELKVRKIKLSDAKQKFGFNKANQDEVFYEWKHALEEEKAEEAEHYKKEYYELEDLLHELKAKVAEEEASVAEIENQTNVYHDELKKWKTAEKKRLEPLDKLNKKMDAIRARGMDIQQVVVDELGKGGEVKWGAVDRCESCHVAINRDGFENEKNPFKTHPFRQEIFGKHPIEKFGCTTCHGGQGRATQIINKPLEKGDFVHGIVRHWSDPLHRGDFLQASCSKCHMDQWKLPHAPVGMDGKKLFWNLGCTGCHNIKGFENAPRVGPSLKKVADKVNNEWLIEWIKNPKGYLPHTKMPKAPLDIDEPGQVEKVAAYVIQNSEPYQKPFGSFPGGDAEAGKKTFEMVGCLGCHTMKSGPADPADPEKKPTEQGGGLAAALDKIGSKTSADWIYNWIQDPKSYNPEAKMPDLRLTPQEAANITAYLMQQGTPQPQDVELGKRLQDPENSKKGFLLISQYGCYGCHTMKGFENASKLSVDLTAFAKKEIFELDFGDSKIPRTWEDWATGKIKDPRMYLTERTSSKMPNFGLSDEKIHALVVFLKGMKKEEVPDQYIQSKVIRRQKEIDDGRRLVERLNCKGCHTIEGEGRFIEKVIGSDKAPPVLDGIGARVRPDWMFKFLKDPSSFKLRPWIEVRMPTFNFTDEQANTLIKYFSALNEVPADFSTVPHTPPTAESLAAGAKLASSEYFSCFSCHIQGSKTPTNSPEQWGPDLQLARQRIRYGFIPEWVKDPQKFTPGVKMPAFLPSDDAAAPDILGGDRQKQAEALRDYLMSLDGSTSSSSSSSSSDQKK